MASATPIDSLLDILELIERTERQAEGLSREEFIADPDVLDATAYRILAIGEASKYLDDDLKARYPLVPWRDIVAVRNCHALRRFVRSVNWRP